MREKTLELEHECGKIKEEAMTHSFSKSQGGSQREGHAEVCDRDKQSLLQRKAAGSLGQRSIVLQRLGKMQGSFQNWQGLLRTYSVPRCVLSSFTFHKKVGGKNYSSGFRR